MPDLQSAGLQLVSRGGSWRAVEVLGVCQDCVSWAVLITVGVMVVVTWAGIGVWGGCRGGCGQMGMGRASGERLSLGVVRWGWVVVGELDV